MKPATKVRTFTRLVAAVLMAGLPFESVHAGIALATTPMANSAPTVVRPNLMFMLDDSGSMDWDYLPDPAQNFSGQYGYNTSQCNGVAYNPLVTYSAPVNPDGTPLNATPTSFTAAYRDGYNTAAGTVNLNTGYTGGSGSGNSGISLTPQAAFYYDYSGTQNTPQLQNYFNSSSTFYQECNSTIGSAPGSNVFTLHRLATTATTTLTTTLTSTGGTITVNSTSTKTSVSGITVTINGSQKQILSATTSQTTNANTMASNIVSGINACTGGLTGNCTVAGYSATRSGNVVTIIPQVGNIPDNGTNPAVTNSVGNFTYTYTAFQGPINTTVTSITVGSTQLLAVNASGSGRPQLASDIASKINSGGSGYTATVSSNVVTVTAPAGSGVGLTPVVTVSAGGPGTMSVVVGGPFPDSDPVKLQNFANWYSYYSHRMLMMKTGAGLAFQRVTDAFRVGFMTMDNNNPPNFLAVDTFTPTQKASFYSQLYGAIASNSTPLREVLSHVGQYYAHKFGSVTKYTATITVSGSTSTSVTSIKVNGVELMQDVSQVNTSPHNVALLVANQINAPIVTDYGASVCAPSGTTCPLGNIITITGPASANGATPVITTDGGGMTFAATAFTATTAANSINGVTPADPMQYSCQQNFVLLSTDGYWNGPNTYDLNNNAVGQVDGLLARPYNDGAQSATTTTTTYLRHVYSTSTAAIAGLGGANCSTGKRGIDTEQIQSCAVTSPSTTPVCTAWSNTGNTVYLSPFTSSASTCTSATINLPTPNPSVSTIPNVAPYNPNPNTTAGANGGTPNTLADVAAYYYQTDLRDNSLGNCTGAPIPPTNVSNSVCDNNVFQTSLDNQTQQHMTTFTLGLGVRGRMVYSSSYLTDTTGDYVSVKLGSNASSTVCTWQTAGTVCNWPVPTSGSPETTDDLWHAAVNGHGAYFSATDPNSLANGLQNALVSIQSRVGAASAAATSTLNPVAGNNQAFVASYTTQVWSGNLEARGINTDTGAVNQNANWCLENVVAGACASPSFVTTDTTGNTTAYFCDTPNSVVCPNGTLTGTDCKVPVSTSCTGTMNSLVSDLTDTRTIYTPAHNSLVAGVAVTDGSQLVPFDATFQAANPTYFSSTIVSQLSQYPASTDNSPWAVAFRTNAPGANLLAFLRGEHGHEYNRSTVTTDQQWFRHRDQVTGDAVESQPVYLAGPVFNYPYSGYSQFKTAQTTTATYKNAVNAGTVYMGTNDGMLHAIAADTGIERWAYVPSMVIPNMWLLADNQYADKHINYVNGSAVTTDVCTARCSNPVTGIASNDPVWKTILVAGLDGGGRGYFALDITNPTAPVLLWEFSTTTGIGKVKDADLGYTYGEPVVTRKNDGTWVVLVTSGYDNGTDSSVLTGTTTPATFVANSPTGSGHGYLYVLDAGTGTILSKIDTGVGTASAPSGLAKIAGYNVESGGNRASYVYGGDLLGNLWRFDINDTTTTAVVGTGSAFKFATLFDNAVPAVAQPVMTTPILGTISGKRVVFIGTGKYLETSDLTTTQQQTEYAILDDNATATLVNPRNTATSNMVQQFLINNPDGSATRLSAASAGATVTGANAINWGVNRGWFVDFPASRERVNIDAKLVEGTLLVPTIVPSATDCAPGGSGWLNFFNYTTGAAVLPSPGIAGVKYDTPIVGLNVLFIGGNPVVEVVTATQPTPTIQPSVQFSASAAAFAGQRVLWRELVP